MILYYMNQYYFIYVVTITSGEVEHVNFECLSYIISILCFCCIHESARSL